MSFDELRQEYDCMPLEEASLAAEPDEQLRRWIDDAAAERMPVANAMALATVGDAGECSAPSRRMVLLKELDGRGLVFFTNYESRKARELRANPRAALLFWWAPMHRQVRVEGMV